MIIEIRNATVLDPSVDQEPVAGGSVFIENGHFTDHLTQTPDRIIDASGRAVFPGLIDAHCHLRDPGFEYKEDIESGTKSAAKGGFTTVACMPNTRPVCDHEAVVRYMLEKAARVGHARVLPIGSVSKEQKGLELAEMGLMKEAGIVAVSDDGRPIESSEMMRKGMQYAWQFGLSVISHCEDLSLAAGRSMNEGLTSTALGLAGIPDTAESIMVARDCLLSEYLDIPVHIAHVSCRSSVRIIREAKARGVRITAETCPHYFALTEAHCLNFNTMAKLNPPLRTDDDVTAVIEGIADGTIDCIVTDHAPHHSDEKVVPFDDAPNGIIGFETAFALGYTRLVQTGKMTLSHWLKTMTINPARLFKLPLGTLQKGCSADLVLVDLDQSWRVDRDEMLSKSRNTPFQDMILNGRVDLTICGGKITYESFC